MTEQMCPIWNRPARVSLKRGHLDLYEVDHPRAGGMYEITGTAKGMVGDRDAEFLRQATEFITRQNLMGLTPSVDSESVRRISEIALPWVGERAERLLKHLEMRSPTIGENVSFSEVETDRVLAATASLDNSEVSYLLEMLRDDLLLTFQGSGQHLPTVRITPAGHRKLHQWRTIQIESSQAFVAMWFSEGMTEAFASGIEPGIRDAGYNVMRIDRKEHSNKIDDEIIAEIRRSKFVVADFTCEPEKARGGVYFEAGFAKGLGREVVWTCRNDCLAHVHFDTRQYAHIVWETPAELRDKLTKRICAVLGDGPNKGGGVR